MRWERINDYYYGNEFGGKKEREKLNWYFICKN